MSTQRRSSIKMYERFHASRRRLIDDDVVADVRIFLAALVGACADAGIPKERVAVDPGLGFGKTLEHNLEQNLRNQSNNNAYKNDGAR